MNNGLSLISLAALFYSTYDRDATSEGESVTTIIKPLKKFLMAKEVEKVFEESPELQSYSVDAQLPMFFGNALHNYFEEALKNPEKTLEFLQENLGVSKAECNVLQKTLIVEERREREIAGKKISGKVDYIIDGQIYDLKTTSAYTFMSGTKNEDYALQGSIYKWLYSDIVTKDYMTIIHVFTDWSKARAKSSPDYPQARVLELQIPLKSLKETEDYLTNKIQAIKRFEGKDQSKFPRCSDEDLWKSDDLFKYYANPANTQRATKNFNNFAEAESYRISKGKGIVITVPGTIKACLYCPAVSICEQAQGYIESGQLVLGE